MTLLLCVLAFQAQAADYNPIYRGEFGAIVSRKPNALLVESIHNRKAGKALDIGMGQGRNTIYLAQQGWDVTGIDPADEGVRIAKAEAARQGLKIRAEVTTFEQFDFGENQWDLIVLTYEPTKAIAPKVVQALRLGGLVVTKRVWPTGSFADNELLSLFKGLRVLRYEDVWARPDWGAQNIDERLVRLLAEKPVPLDPGCIWKAKPVEVGGTVCWDTALLRCRPDGWQFTREKCGP